jgi:hypothetical protein
MTPQEREAEFKRAITQFARSDDVECLLDGLQARYLGSWASSRADQAEHREHLYRMVQAVEALKAEIRSVASDEAFVALNSRRVLKKIQK